MFLLSLPLKLGVHPALEKDIKLGIGRFGPYVVCDGDYRSIPKAQPLFEVNLEVSLELFAKPKKGRGGATPLKEFAVYPDTEDKIQVFNGKYGPYVKCGKVNASLPDEVEVENVTFEQACELLAPKMKKKKAKKKKAAKKKTTKKTVTKKATTAKKTTKKKVVRRKAAAKE